MRIGYAGSFKKTLDTARAHNASSVSIQEYYCFCNFDTLADAEAFSNAMGEDQPVNTGRPFVKFEVTILHKCAR